MLVTDRFVYLHMPKTAGTWVQHHMKGALGGVHPSPLSHVRVSNFAEHLEGRIVFGTVRNPWDWYISWYQFIRASKWWRNNFLVAFGDPDDTDAALYGMTHPDPKVAPVAHKIPFDLSTFQARGVGLYTHLFNASFCDRDGTPLVDYLVDVGHLRKGIREITGLDFKGPPMNVKGDRPHTVLDPYRVWTQERFRWVREADAGVLALLGYDRPHGPPAEPLMRFSGAA